MLRVRDVISVDRTGMPTDADLYEYMERSINKSALLNVSETGSNFYELCMWNLVFLSTGQGFVQSLSLLDGKLKEIANYGFVLVRNGKLEGMNIIFALTTKGKLVIAKDGMHGLILVYRDRRMEISNIRHLPEKEHIEWLFYAPPNFSWFVQTPRGGKGWTPYGGKGGRFADHFEITFDAAIDEHFDANPITRVSDNEGDTLTPLDIPTDSTAHAHPKRHLVKAYDVLRDRDAKHKKRKHHDHVDLFHMKTHTLKHRKASPCFAAFNSRSNWHNVLQRLFNDAHKETSAPPFLCSPLAMLPVMQLHSREKFNDYDTAIYAMYMIEYEGMIISVCRYEPMTWTFSILFRCGAAFRTEDTIPTRIELDELRDVFHDYIRAKVTINHMDLANQPWTHVWRSLFTAMQTYIEDTIPDPIHDSPHTRFFTYPGAWIVLT